MPRIRPHTPSFKRDEERSTQRDNDPPHTPSYSSGHTSAHSPLYSSGHSSTYTPSYSSGHTSAHTPSYATDQSQSWSERGATRAVSTPQGAAWRPAATPVTASVERMTATWL